jgi:cytochrome P450
MYEVPAAQARDRMAKTCLEIIKQKRIELAEGKSSENMSLVDIILRQEESDSLTSLDGNSSSSSSKETTSRITDYDLVANMKTFFFAGSDTTAIGMTWTVFFLSQTPSFLKLVRKEADDFFNKLKQFDNRWNNSIESENEEEKSKELMDLVSELVHCRAAMKEAVRVACPAANLLLQSAERVVTTLSDGTVIHPNDQIFINLDSRLWDSKVFPQPRDFVPERWLPSSSTSTSTSLEQEQKLNLMEEAFVAFGAGPRKCPGTQTESIRVSYY